jgi:hypothetical protein
MSGMRSIEAMYTLDKHELEEVMRPHKSGFNQKQSNQPAGKKPAPTKHKERLAQALERVKGFRYGQK